MNFFFVGAMRSYRFGAMIHDTKVHRNDVVVYGNSAFSRRQSSAVTVNRKTKYQSTKQNNRLLQKICPCQKHHGKCSLQTDPNVESIAVFRNQCLAVVVLRATRSILSTTTARQRIKTTRQAQGRSVCRNVCALGKVSTRKTHCAQRSSLDCMCIGNGSLDQMHTSASGLFSTSQNKIKTGLIER